MGNALAVDRYGLEGVEASARREIEGARLWIQQGQKADSSEGEGESTAVDWLTKAGSAALLDPEPSHLSLRQAWSTVFPATQFSESGTHKSSRRAI